MPTRREFLKLGGATAAAYALTRNRLLRLAFAEPLAMGLSDPALQPKFVEYVPNALDPGFIFETQASGPLTWPGRTFEIQSESTPVPIRWENNLLGKGGKPLPHLLTVDTSLHWAYSLHGYDGYSIKKNGVPIITHLHGGHSDFQFDGNPEFFYSPDYEIIGPQWYQNGLTGIQKDFVYDNDVPAGTLWYHDHALGITRLNVYAGMAGFYIVRDEFDTGAADNPLELPAFPYELAYAIQDRMFTDKGALFYPGFPGDPFWFDFITDQGLADKDVPQPSALAEFFGDHMVVNGKIWPKADVEPRNYRMRLLNGTDSRFLVIQFVEANIGDTELPTTGSTLPFYVVGSDQGLADSATPVNTLVFEPGGRYDIVFNFRPHDGKRIIMKNIGGDAPFGGDYGDDLAPEDVFPNRQTDRIMAFDVVLNEDKSVGDNFDGTSFDPGYGGVPGSPTTRMVALFEGTDEFGRLQPLLGNDDPGTDQNGVEVSEWKASAWDNPTTETPANGAVEEWEIYNFTGDAHPIHLHLVNFEIKGRYAITFDDGGPPQAVLQHNGLYGEAPSINDVTVGDAVPAASEYVENAPKDMVTALPEQMTKIKVKFDKTGRYVWHCHILSHEDHEMMRVLEVQ
jgi:FtsP/CotA-like multicopper oxidase with cupredoxin domain